MQAYSGLHAGRLKAIMLGTRNTKKMPRFCNYLLDTTCNSCSRHNSFTRIPQVLPVVCMHTHKYTFIDQYLQ